MLLKSISKDNHKKKSCVPNVLVSYIFPPEINFLSCYAYSSPVLVLCRFNILNITVWWTILFLGLLGGMKDDGMKKEVSRTALKIITSMKRDWMQVWYGNYRIFYRLHVGSCWSWFWIQKILADRKKAQWPMWCGFIHICAFSWCQVYQVRYCK